MPIDPNMLAYFATTMGQGLMNPDDPMQGVAGVTKQTIATQNYMKMVKQMLAGGDSKFSTDGKKFKLDGPSALLGDVSGLLKDEKVPFKGAPSGMAMNAPGGQLDTQQNQLRQSFLNPSNGSLDISSAGLVGLTPENISQALQLKFTKESLEQKKLSDLAKMMQPAEVKDERTTKIKNYEYYLEQEKTAGKTPKSMEEWDTGLVKERRLYNEAIASGMSKEENPFHEWLFDLKRAGATDITIGEQVIQKGRSKDIVRVTSSTYAQEMRDDIAKDPERKLEEPYIIKYKKAGMGYDEAQIRARDAVLYDTMYKGLQIAYKKIGKEVTWGETGWEVDGVEVQGYP